MMSRANPAVRRVAILFFLWGSTPSFALDLAGFDPASMGTGGAGVAWGGRAGVASNPALHALTDTRAEILIDMAHAGRQADHQAKLRDALNTFQADAHVFQQTQAEPDRLTLVESMRVLSETSRRHQLSGGGRIMFPNLPVALGAYVNGTYSELIAPRMRATDSAYTPNVSVRIARKAIAIIDTGAVFAGTIRGDAGRSRTALGVSPKLLSVRTYVGTTPAENANIDSIPTETHDFGKMNVDLGLVQELGFDWTVGARVLNAVPFSVTANQADSMIYQSRPSLRVGLAHRAERWIVALDSDINANGGFDFQARQRVVSLGGQFRANDWLSLRAGAFADIAGQSRDNSGLATGLGVVTEYLNADAAAMWTRRDWILAGRIGVAF